MSANLQTFLAFAVVLAAALWLARRTLRKKSGCGGDCACPTSDLKAKSRH